MWPSPLVLLAFLASFPAGLIGQGDDLTETPIDCSVYGLKRMLRNGERKEIGRNRILLLDYYDGNDPRQIFLNPSSGCDGVDPNCKDTTFSLEITDYSGLGFITLSSDGLYTGFGDDKFQQSIPFSRPDDDISVSDDGFYHVINGIGDFKIYCQKSTGYIKIEGRIQQRGFLPAPSGACIGGDLFNDPSDTRELSPLVNPTIVEENVVLYANDLSKVSLDKLDDVNIPAIIADCEEDMNICLTNRDASFCYNMGCFMAPYITKLVENVDSDYLETMQCTNTMNSLCEADSGKEYQRCSPSCSPQRCGEQETSQFCTQTCSNDGCFCPAGTLMRADGICVGPDECTCVNDGQKYDIGMIMNSDIQTCVCKSGGIFDCKNVPDTRCIIYGGPFYQVLTFDNQDISFEQNSQCTYKMFSTSNIDRNIYENVHKLYFNIEVSDNCVGGICDKVVYIDVDDVANNKYRKFTLKHTQTWTDVSVDGGDTNLPYGANNVWIYKNSDRHLRFAVTDPSTNKQILEVLSDGEKITMTLDESYKQQVEGLCGNFNNNIKDDLKTQIGETETNFAKLADTWAGGCSGATNIPSNPCSSQYDHNKASQCDKISTAELMMTCHGHINPISYVAKCKQDVCSHSEDPSKEKSLLCMAYATYASECTRHNVDMGNWREALGCEMTCSEGMVYNSCLSSCDLTCRNVQPTNCQNTNPGCIEGCWCQEGEVYNDESGMCIPKSECPCYFRDVPYDEGAVRQDECNQCTCNEGQWSCTDIVCTDENTCGPNEYWKNYTSICEKDRSCGTLHTICNTHDQSMYAACVCKTGMVRYNGECINTDECPCVFEDTTYSVGQTREHGLFQECTCTHGGRWECGSHECPDVCSIYGLSHFKTFDGLSYTFEGDCDYTLLKSGDVEIVLSSYACGTAGVTCTNSIIINYKGEEMLHLIRGMDPVASDSSGAIFTLREQGNFLIIMLLDFEIHYDIHTGVNLYVYANKGIVTTGMFGLCGNYNNDSTDELTMQNNAIADNIQTFAHSLAKSDCALEAPVEDPCEGSPKKYWAQAICSALDADDGPFAPCHSTVPKTQFVMDCMYDSCGCDRGGDCECPCNVASAYEKACQENGITIQYRTTMFCPQMCPGDMTFLDCGTGEPTSCLELAQQDVQYNGTRCLEGCYCAPGYVQDYNGECTLAEECPCIDEYGVVKEPSSTWHSGNECNICQCVRGRIACQEMADCVPTETPTTTFTTIPPTFSTGFPLMTTRVTTNQDSTTQTSTTIGTTRTTSAPTSSPTTAGPTNIPMCQYNSTYSLEVNTEVAKENNPCEIIRCASNLTLVEYTKTCNVMCKEGEKLTYIEGRCCGVCETGYETTTIQTESTTSFPGTTIQPTMTPATDTTTKQPGTTSAPG
ncbi:unnamed protein product, partial [Owenia fusiformis]